MRTSREFGIKKENLTPEFPRKKVFQKNVDFSTKSNPHTIRYVTISRIRNEKRKPGARSLKKEKLKGQKNKALIHGQHKTFSAIRKVMI